MASPLPADSGSGGPPPIAGLRRSVSSVLLKTIPAWLVSMLVHIIVLLAMALVVNNVQKPGPPRLITATVPEAVSYTHLTLPTIYSV